MLRHFAAFLCLTAVLATPPSAAALEREIQDQRPAPSGLVVVSPTRFEEDIKPGQRRTLRVEIFNDDPENVVDISLRSGDLGPSSDPSSLAERVQDGEFGAGDWVTFEVDELRLEPLEVVKLDAYVDAPGNAPIGTNLAAISVRTAIADGPIGAADNDGAVKIDAVVQVFLTVPGPIKHDLRITDVDVRDTLILDSTRFAVYEVTFQNRGTINEHVSGGLAVRSIFGNTAFRGDIDDLIVLRGASRTARVVWRDIPWVGVFTPEVRVRGDDAKAVSRSGERIYVLPWWLPVLLAGVILLPAAYLWWRRRQEWRQYLDDETDEPHDADWADPDGLHGR